MWKKTILLTLTLAVLQLPSLMSTSAASNTEATIQRWQVVFRSFTIPPGHQIIQFSTGARPPLDALRFIAVGNPDLKISRVVGTNQGLPDLVFNPPATPFEFTINSVQQPLFNCPSSDFIFTVMNDGDRDHVMNIGGVYR
jgi:hypothetical protein